MYKHDVITPASPRTAGSLPETGAPTQPPWRSSPQSRLHTYVAMMVLLSTLMAGGCDNHASTEHRTNASPSLTTDTPGSQGSSLRSRSTSATTSATTTDPVATTAVIAFSRYITATYTAQRAPRQPGDAFKPEADFTRYAFDPIRTQEDAYISSLATGGEAFRGTPPTPRVRVARTDPGAKPYPTVVLTNCPTPAPTWVAYDTKTGEPVAYTKAQVSPPYLATVTVIFYEGHWGVQKISVDTGRTCSA